MVEYDGRLVEQIVSTLPIGLYAKRRIELALDETVPTSYYSPTTDEIIISERIIKQGLQNMPDTYAEEEIETAVRSMVYHEVSHAVLTPSTWKIQDYENIFEDERIETVFNSYYLDTDFKDQVYRINGYRSNADIPAPKDGMEAFYNIVRFHYGKEEFIKRTYEIIKKYARICNANKYEWSWNSTDKDIDNYKMFQNYRSEIQKLYQDVIKDFKSNPPPPNGGGEGEGEGEGNQSSNGNGNSQGENANGQSKPFDLDENTDIGYNGNTKNESDEESQQSNGNGQGNGQGEDGEDSSEGEANDPNGEGNAKGEQNGKGRGNQIAEEAFNALLDKRYDSSLYATIDNIVSNFNKKTGGGSSLPAYSGILNPRNVANDDYRYFDRKCAINGQNQFGSMHLNLFLDNSGSFEPNKDIVNSLLAVLCEIEKRNKNFTFNVVHCAVGERLITDKRKYGLDCNGGTLLSHEAKDLYKSLQKHNTCNYNIILYDGICIDRYKDNLHNFSAFNYGNCMIISDYSNEKYIQADCPKAKYVITNNYTKELIDNVIRALKIGFR